MSTPLPATHAPGLSGEPPPAWSMSIVVAAALAQLVLVWAVTFFPTIDGPAHVHLAHAFHEAILGDSFYAGLVEFNDRINPNIATQSVLVALMAVASPATAEKLWLTLYFTSFAGAGAYVLRAINRQAICLLPLLAFCSVSFPLAFGFYNFSFSAVVFLVWFGYWWRHRDAFRAAVIIGHAVFAALAFATHIFSLLVTLLAIGLTGFVLICTELVRHVRGEGYRASGPWWRPFATHALSPLIGSLPEIVVCVHFLLVRFGARTSSGAAGIGESDPIRLHEMLTGSSLAPYDVQEFMAVSAFLLFLLFLTAILLRYWKPVPGVSALLICLAVFIAIYLTMPSRWIVRWMPDRFQPMLYLVLILCIACLLPLRLRRTHWAMIAATGIGILILSVAVRLQVFQRIDSIQREVMSIAPHIRPNSTLIGLRLHAWLNGRPFPADLDVLIQSGSRVATSRHSVDLKNFQGQSDDHPIQFRPGVSATAALGGDRAITSIPPRVKLMAYEEQTGRRIDYVFLYGYREAMAFKELLKDLDQQLDENYQLIHVSRPTGLVHLYQRRPGRDTAQASLQDARP